MDSDIGGILENLWGGDAGAKNFFFFGCVVKINYYKKK